MPDINMVDKKYLGEKIRFYRNKAALTQIELAERLHISFQAISSWECGNTLPDIENICELASVLGVSLDALLREQKRSQDMAYIGIDGGGSSTEFALFTTEGTVLKCFKLSGANASTIGVSNALSVFHKGIDTCLSCSDMEVGGIFIGCAGSMLDEVARKLNEAYPNIPILIDSDGVNALLSGDGDSAMICGTGTVFFKHDNGAYRKYAGWGWRWGDYGSAFNFGREAICHARAYEDGVESSALIYSLIKERIGSQKLSEEMPVLKDIAAIAKNACVVFEAYSQNDPYAEKIIRGEMQRLAWLVKSVCSDGGRIIACGGVNQHYGHITLPILREYLPDNIEIVLPELPPIYGACREACRRFGAQMGDRFFDNFVADYKRADV